MDKLEFTDVSEQEFEKELESAVSIKDDILKSLDVSIEVRVAKKKVPLSQLSNLKCGELLALDTPVDTPVEIFCQGKLIALGELVTDGKTLSVKILETKDEH